MNPESIEKINPDFLFLQEFYSPLDASQIESLKEYPHKIYLDMWYRKQSTLIASKKPITLEMIKEEKKLADLPLIKQSRLSVMLISKENFHFIVKIGT